MTRMNQCILCHQPPAQDDPCATVYASGVGTVQCCSPCACCEQGCDPPLAKTYPVGQPVPLRGGSDGPIDVCGLCRLALRVGEAPTPLRVAVVDLAGTEIAPGCYAACPRCVERFRPLIHARLVQQDYPVPPLAAFGGDWLL